MYTHKVGSAKEFSQAVGQPIGENIEIVLTDDIDLEHFQMKTPITRTFNGVLNGNGHSLKNLSLENDHPGFIRSVRGTIKNLKFDNFNLESQNNTGGICNHNFGTIRNCEVNGRVKSEKRIGGISSYNSGEISKCKFKGKVYSESEKAGGITAKNHSGIIRNCRSCGIIKGGKQVGGVVAKNEESIILCSSSSNLLTEGRAIGGISSINFGDVEKSYFCGHILSKDSDISKATIVTRNYNKVKNCHTLSRLDDYKMVVQNNGHLEDNGIKNSVNKIENAILTKEI